MCRIARQREHSMLSRCLFVPPSKQYIIQRSLRKTSRPEHNYHRREVTVKSHLLACWSLSALWCAHLEAVLELSVDGSEGSATTSA